MSIIICRRRILRCSSIFSWGDWAVGGELSGWQEDSSLRSDSLDPIWKTLPSEVYSPCFVANPIPEPAAGKYKKGLVTLQPEVLRSPSFHRDRRKWPPWRRCGRSGCGRPGGGEGFPFWDDRRDCDGRPRLRHTWERPQPGSEA